jgi:hypothetical protein
MRRGGNWHTSVTVVRFSNRGNAEWRLGSPEKLERGEKWQGLVSIVTPNVD